MRVAVLPREVAARVVTSAVAGGAWAINAVSLALAIPILIAYLADRNLLSALPVPLVVLVGLFLLAVGAALRPTPALVGVFLGVGSLGAIAYELALVTAHPAVLDEAVFLVNRPAVSLVLVGVANTTTITGLLWSTAGLVLSTAVPFVVSQVAGVPFRPGLGALLVYAVYAVAYLGLAAVQSNLRTRVPDFDALEEETRRLGLEENYRNRVAATVHDTLLNDLSIIMTAPDELDERVTSRLRQDLATLTHPDWLRDSEVMVDEQDSSLRNQVMMMMSDLQWRGLTVHVTGSGTGIYRLAPGAASALVDAVRACLENALRHSGATVAEVDIGYTDDEVTVIVSDQGRGFDPDAVADDRLGLRHSVVDRIEAVGGAVKVWSSPGAGTSIVLRLPVLEILRPHEEAEHGRP